MCISTDASGKGASLVAAVVQKEMEQQMYNGANKNNHHQQECEP